MKTNKILKVMLTIIILIILVLVAFVGVFVQDKNRLVNAVKGYSMGMDLGFERELVFSPVKENKTNYYDKNGKLVDSNTVTEENKKDYTAKEEPINKSEALNKQNYNTSKQIIEKRLNNMGIQEYFMTLDEESGNILVRTLETDNIDNMIYSMYGQGELILEDADTQEVLLNNSDIKNVKVAYYNEQTGTKVYLTVQLDKEGTEKLANISSKYVETKDAEGKTTTKKVKLYIDKNLVIDTYFGEPVNNGVLQLAIGQATTDNAQLQQYLMSASAEATKLSYGSLPVIYSTTQNTVISSPITNDIIKAGISILVIVLTAILAYLIIRYKERGMIAAALFIGFIAVLTLVMRYTNSYITPQSIVAVILMIVFNLGVLNRLLRKLRNYDPNEDTPKAILNKGILKSIFVLIPVFVISVVYCLFNAMTINSFGIAMFWGIGVFVLYTYTITRTLLLNFEYLFEE